MLYNTLYSLNNGIYLSKYDFPELIAQIELKGACIDGYFGTSPVIIKEYLEYEGYQVKMLYGQEAQNYYEVKKLQDNYDSYIVTVYNDKNDINKYVHTMNITKFDLDGSVKYILRNDYKDNTASQDSIIECIEEYNKGKSQTICIMGVKK